MPTTHSKEGTGTPFVRPMKLRPMDFSILSVLENGRNVSTNLAVELDTSRQYVTERLTQIADYGLVAKVGPSENSGLYEITAAGQAALELRDEYDAADDFDAVIDNYLGADE